MKKVLAAIALIGAVGVAQAAPATLTSVTSYSKNGTSAWLIGASTATWDVNTVTGVATQTGGTYSGEVRLGPPTLLFRHTMVDGVLSSGAATATDWKCVEGNAPFGAHLCGNYSYGPNFFNETVYTPTATGGTVGPFGGDDYYIGPPQTLANSYSGLTLSDLGSGNWMLSNAVPGVSGYDFVFNVAVVPVPAAVWLFGSALGLMGVMRRRSAA
ncbi:MAG: hypothetical protein WAU48_11445 [Gammaproteobacteria bacterium]